MMTTLTDRARAAYTAHLQSILERSAADAQATAGVRAAYLAAALHKNLGITVAVTPTPATPTVGPTVTVDGLVFALGDEDWDVRLVPTCSVCGLAPAGYWPVVITLCDLGAALSHPARPCWTCQAAPGGTPAPRCTPATCAPAERTLLDALAACLGYWDAEAT